MAGGKIAELFAELGFKIDKAELTKLNQFESVLNGIATAATKAKEALGALQGVVKIPGVQAGKTAAVPPVLAVQPTTAAVPPVLAPAAGAAAGNTAVLQGLKSFGIFAKQLVGFGSLALALRALIGGFMSMMRSSMAASFGLDKFTRQTGVTLEEMKRWEQVAIANDISAQEIMDNMQALQQNAVKISMGLGGTNANRWGIDPLAALKDPGQVYRRFQEVTRGMSQAQAMAVAEAAGISARVAQVLLREREHPTAITEGLALSKEQLETTRSLASAWNTLRLIMSSLADKITSDLAPGLNSVLEFFTKVGAFFTTYDQERRTALAGGLMGGPMGFALPVIRGLVGQQTTHVTNNVDVRASGVENPKETAELARNALQQVIQDTYFNRANSFGPQGLSRQ